MWYIFVRSHRVIPVTSYTDICYKYNHLTLCLSYIWNTTFKKYKLWYDFGWKGIPFLDLPFIYNFNLIKKHYWWILAPLNVYQNKISRVFTLTFTLILDETFMKCVLSFKRYKLKMFYTRFYKVQFHFCQ